MWRLSKLEIRGFKSFAEPVELVFPDGITAVVGPNGCGKSNISDAIVWALGEQSTSVLRAQKMQDVIFQGTSGRKPTGVAEVTLHMMRAPGTDTDSAQSEVAAEVDEISITRRLYRSGDSEYLLDGERCRLRDIRERLLGTGLGARACFIIGQGRIDQVLSASPVDRRAPIEEAAGVSLYRRRRHVTNLKLEATAQDLARAEDICDEVARQMRSLKRQAGRARRYERLRDRLREIERRWLYLEVESLDGRSRVAAAALDGSRVAEEGIREELDNASARWELARRRWRKSREEEATRRQALYAAQVDLERTRAEESRQRDRATFALERGDEARARRDELAQQRLELSSLVEARDAAAHEVTAIEERALADLERARRALAAIEELASAEAEERQAMEAAGAPVESIELRPLVDSMEVEASDRSAVALALGALLRAPVLDAEEVEPWLGALESRSVSGRSARMLPPATTEHASQAPDERVVACLAERVRTSGPAGEVVAAFLHRTWVVPDARTVLELAETHRGHAFVDLAGHIWASGPEVRYRHAETAHDPWARGDVEQERLEITAFVPPESGSTTELPRPAAVRAAEDACERAAAEQRARHTQTAAVRREADGARARLRRLDAEIRRAEEQIETLTVSVQDAGERAERAKREAKAAGERCAALEAEVAAPAEVDIAAEAEIAGLEAVLAASRRSLERAQEKRSTLEVRAAELRIEHDYLRHRVRERLGEDVAELVASVRAEQERAAEEGEERGNDDVVTMREQIREIEDAIGRLGPVNLVAYEDFKVQEERFEDLDGQRRDLRGAVANLRSAIRHIDEECVERFATAFQSIDGYFNRIFRQLFGGGRAGMRLEDPEDPLGSGIEIVAQPPGKRLQSIRLLSGGESSLVALALMFAIFEYRPSPFCILDEADAALDEANVNRFVQSLRDNEEKAQFILITHNKRSMEAADLLYGVTMQESGVSALVSVQLN